MRDDGEMARIPDLIPFCHEHGLRILTVAELIRYRLRNERYIVRAGESRIQTRYGEFRMIAYESEVNGGESHIALVRGDLCPGVPPSMRCRLLRGGLPGEFKCAPPCPHAVLVRVHTRCTAGDIFGADCHCREMLDQSMRMIAEEGCGAILYLHNTSRGFAIDHTPADAFEPGGAVTPAAAREAGIGRLILHKELRQREGSQDRIGAHSSRHRPGRPDPVGPGHSAHPAVVEHADAHPGARRLRPGDRGTGAHPGRRVHPGGVRRHFSRMIRAGGINPGDQNYSRNRGLSF